MTTEQIINLVELVATAIIIPVVGWAYSKGSDLITRFNRHELCFREHEAHVKERLKELDSLKASDSKNDGRFSKVEDAICHIRESLERVDNQFQTIISKLEQLPRIATLLESHAKDIDNFVPRREIESRLKATEDRLNAMQTGGKF